MKNEKIKVKSSPLRDKSYLFAVQIVRLAQSLQAEKKEFVLSRQLLRSGTAIGALLREAEFGQSTPDFINKLHISLKEANETEYWLNLLKDTGCIEIEIFEKRHAECKELIAMLVSSIKTLKQKVNKP